ncbi:Zinc finger DHHC-type palmitoyltransferase [Penicillium cf. griseofulvum]|nr:Zinc finger DHHC-type palmitoyltransferase [Penicillium cf. griseofulvum]
MENPADRPNTGETNQGSTPHHVLGIPRPPSVGGISSRLTEDDDGERTQSYTSVHPPPPVATLCFQTWSASNTELNQCA